MTCVPWGRSVAPSSLAWSAILRALIAERAQLVIRLAQPRAQRGRLAAAEGLGRRPAGRVEPKQGVVAGRVGGRRGVARRRRPDQVERRLLRAHLRLAPLQLEVERFELAEELLRRPHRKGLGRDVGDLHPLDLCSVGLDANRIGVDRLRQRRKTELGGVRERQLGGADDAARSPKTVTLLIGAPISVAGRVAESATARRLGVIGGIL